ncbi:MAG: phage tail tape measure protein [Nocardioidaceae bacterium]|nr:phage tail tape measure protein [Nocardioidaceae bacterium]
MTYTFKGIFTNLTAGITTAGRNVTELNTKLTALDANGKKMRAGLTQIGDTAGKVGLAAAAGLGAAVLSAANFDQAMSNVRAATHETAANMEALRAAAIKAGADTKFSATEAANGIEELAKAGVSTKDVLAGGLSGALDLAAAGGLGVADAAQIAATALTQFKLSGKDVPHVADLLAAAAGKAQGDVSDMSMALKQAGLVASQAGVSIEETTGTLAAFASAGLLGSDAGTSFRTMLLRLNPQSAQAADLIKQYNLSAFDAQGNFIGMAQYAQKLKDGLKNLSVEQRQAALSTIFGTDAIRAANVLYDQGAKGIADWTDKVNDQGYAAETAAIKMDNLKGDLEQFKGSLETALIGAGEGSQGPLRSLVQGATDAANAFNKLPGSAQGSVTAILGLTAAAAGTLFVFSRVMRAVAETRTALDQLGVSGTRAGRLLNTGLKVSAILAGLEIVDSTISSLFNQNLDDSNLGRSLEALASGRVTGEIRDKFGKDLDHLVRQLHQATDDGLTGFNRALVQNSGPLKSIMRNPFEKLQDSKSVGFDTAVDNIKKLDAALAALVEGGQGDKAAAIIQRIKDAGADSDLLSQGFKQYYLAVENAGDAADAATGPTANLSSKIGDAGSSAALTAEQITGLAQAMRDQRQAALSAFDAETQWRQAVKDAMKQAKESNAGIKGNSDEALKNRGVISSLAAAWNNQSEAVKNNKKRFAEARQTFIDTAVGMGVPIEQAKRLARSFLEIPQSRVIDVHANTGQAMTAAQALKNLLDDLHDRNIHVKVTGSTNATVAEATANAHGGYIVGPGTATSDSIPARLSNGEYVVRAAAVDKYGVAMFDSINSMRFADGGLVAAADAMMRAMPAYANGGRVWAPASGSSGQGIDYNQLANAVSGRRLFEYRDSREALLWAMRTALRETPIVKVPSDPALLNGLI